MPYFDTEMIFRWDVRSKFALFIHADAMKVEDEVISIEQEGEGSVRIAFHSDFFRSNPCGRYIVALRILKNGAFLPEVIHGNRPLWLQETDRWWQNTVLNSLSFAALSFGVEELSKVRGVRGVKHLFVAHQLWSINQVRGNHKLGSDAGSALRAFLKAQGRTFWSELREQNILLHAYPINAIGAVHAYLNGEEISKIWTSSNYWNEAWIRLLLNRTNIADFQDVRDVKALIPEGREVVLRKSIDNCHVLYGLQDLRVSDVNNYPYDHLQMLITEDGAACLETA